MIRPEGVALEQQAQKVYGQKGPIALELALQTNEDLKDASKWSARIGMGVVGIGEAVYVGGKRKLGVGIQLAGLALSALGVAGERYFDRQAELVATEIGSRVERGQFAEYVRGQSVTQPRDAADVRRLMH